MNHVANVSDIVELHTSPAIFARIQDQLGEMQRRVSSIGE